MGGNILIKNASEVVTCHGFKAKQGGEMKDLHIIENGSVVVEEGRIRAVGKTTEILSGLDESGFEVIDATGKAVLPGFVDSHTHFVFGGYRAEEFAWRLRGDSYMSIMERGGGILSTVRATREATREELIASGMKRLDSMLSFGVTTVEGKSGYGLDRETEIKQLEVMAYLQENHPLDIAATFLGAHAVPGEYKGREDDFIDFMLREVMPEVRERGLAEFCDIFCEKNVFSVDRSRRLLKGAGEMGFKIKLHADEIVSLGGAELAAELGAVSADHLLQASDKGIQDMARAGVVATLLPGTAFSLKEPYARGREMIDKGCAVALATDLNPGSCFTESVPLLFALATLYMGITTEEAVTAMTINGAAALDRADTVGSIDPGKKGDLIILEFPSYRYIPYHIGVSTVEKVVKDGRLVFDKERRNGPLAGGS
ncbi:MAG: imidazolonepropionase [Deltaproteobacteria bacterium]|nr:imidazolonepropionase [Deltaproteobacteria bacterium]